MLTAQLCFSPNETAIPKVIMPHGFIGFEEYQHYSIVPFFDDQPQNAFWHLKSLDHPDLSFVLLSLDACQINNVHIQEADLQSACQSLGIRLDETYVFLVVTFKQQEDSNVSITVNLRAPWLYHSVTRQAWQIVLPNSEYPIDLEIK